MADEKRPISLTALMLGILNGVRTAEYLGDLESAKLIEAYKNEPGLLDVSVPAFSISAVDIELRFAIEGVNEGDNEIGETSDLRVNISPEFLRELAEHQISVAKLRVTPTSLRILEDAG